MSSGTDVREIANLLLKNHISAVPVVDHERRVEGIVSEGDLIIRSESDTRHRRSWWIELPSTPEDTARDYVRAHGRRARDVMTRNVVTVTEDASLAEIAASLEKHRIIRAPIVRAGESALSAGRDYCRSSPRGSPKRARPTKVSRDSRAVA